METENKVQKSIRMIDEQTVEISFKDDFVFDLESIKKSYSETKEFTGGRRLKRLIICGFNTSITKDARAYGHTENIRLKDEVIAEALVVHTFSQKMITNFYLKFVRNTFPAKSFTDMNNAMEWLSTFS